MSNLTLGLDLGPNSLGWALLDEKSHNIVAAGVRVFPEGVDRDQTGAEISKMQQRRVARGMRRQIARRARRKRQLRETLVAAGLLPEAALSANDDLERIAWERDEFKKADPYELRCRALTLKLTPHEIGRVLLHLAQRRGFKSNRKTDRGAEKRKENSEILAEINQLAQEMEGRTLAQELSRRRGDDPQHYHLTRIRGLHTHRDMYEKEFNAIWNAQKEYYPKLLNDDLCEKIHYHIFFQRDLLPPSPGLIGRCELEPRHPRCPRADRRAQRFRLYQEVNNLRIIDTSTGEERGLTGGERTKLIEYLFGAKERAFDQIRKHLFDQSENIRFNLERGDRTKLKGMTADAAIGGKNALGRDWKKLSEDLKDRIVSAIIDDDEPRLRHLLEQADLEPDRAATLLDRIDLETGYSSYGLHAIKKLLPHLQRGLPLTSRDEKTPCALREAGYLMPWEHAADRQPFLPLPPMLTNPIVRQALFEVRKVVNSILREYVYRPGHTLKAVHVELAREARGTAEQRRKLSKDMRDRERQRDAAADEIRNAGFKPSRDAIDRFLLWQEQEQTCVYTGNPISLRQLLGGEVHVDHVLPYSRSLDDSKMNKVVCFRDANADKGDRTPYEWLAESRPDRYEQIIQRAKKLPYPKLRRFYQQSVELDDFFARQFVDTAYITTQVHQYVQGLGADVLCVKGGHTSELRHHWGLNTVLRSDFLDLKNRDDHRHHAVDAIVIALTSRSRLQQLASIRRAGGTERTGEILDEPWDNFRDNVENVVNAIWVSHRVRRKVAGALHNDTIYGPTDKPDEYVYRKSVESLTPAMVEKIRDPVIRALVEERLRKHGIEPKRGGGKIPAEVWKEPLSMPSGIPVRKVRLLVPSESIRPIRRGKAFVQPGNTHHLCLFERKDAKGKVYRDAVFVAMLDAKRRVQDGVTLFQKTHPDDPNAIFLMSLSGNELVLIPCDGREELYRFETAASTSKQMWFRHHTFAGRSTDKRGQISKKPGTFEGRKVTVDPLGRLRWSND